MEEKIFLTQKYFVFKLSDILNNSLHNTYEVYMELLSEFSKRKIPKSENVEGELPKSKLSVEEGYKLVRPKYLFLE